MFHIHSDRINVLMLMYVVFTYNHLLKPVVAGATTSSIMTLNRTAVEL